MRRLSLGLLLALALTALPLAPAVAFNVPEHGGRYVVDLAGILSEPTEAELTERLRALEAQESTQFVVLTVASLQGEEIASVGEQVFGAWGIGQAGLDNGLLLLHAPTERKVRLEVGKGLEGEMTDLRAGRIVDGLRPYFKQGDFDGGTLWAVGEAIGIVRGAVEAPTQAAGESWPPGALLAALLGVLALGVALAAFLALRGSRESQRPAGLGRPDPGELLYHHRPVPPYPAPAPSSKPVRRASESRRSSDDDDSWRRPSSSSFDSGSSSSFVSGGLSGGGGSCGGGGADSDY